MPRVLTETMPMPSVPRIMVPLSDREKSVLTLCAEGHTTVATGRRLGITESNVKGVHSIIKSKLGTSSMASSVAVAVIYGLVHPEV